VRESYYPFEEGLKAPGPTCISTKCRAAVHEPAAAGAESRAGRSLAGVCDAYAAANQLFGDIVKVTPSSKVVGDLALFLVTNRLTAEDVMNARAPLAFPAASSR
jgi:pyruvate carboxylase